MCEQRYRNYNLEDKEENLGCKIRQEEEVASRQPHGAV
jgi:hypothetical protein